MARYFFDVDDGTGLTRDQDGLFCASLDEVRLEAIRVLPDIVREAMPEGDQRVVRTIVREENGRAIFEASLALDARWR